MTLEQKTCHSLLLILRTCLAHPSAGSRSPCLCLTSVWLVSLFPLRWVVLTCSSSLNPGPAAGNSVNVRGDAVVSSHSVLLQIVILGDVQCHMCVDHTVFSPEIYS